MLSALRRVCLSGAAVPVLCGASLRGVGVDPLLDSVIAFLPSPMDRCVCVHVRCIGLHCLHTGSVPALYSNVDRLDLFHLTVASGRSLRACNN